MFLSRARLAAGLARRSLLAPHTAALSTRSCSLLHLSSTITASCSPLPLRGTFLPQHRASSSAAMASPMLLNLPVGVGPLALNRIHDNIGARPVKRRVGRGVGSGRGRYCGRGMKGRKARAGNHGLLRHDGGQTTLQKGLPKMGAWRPKLEYAYINLWRIQEAVASGRLPVPEERPIDVRDLFNAKLVTLRQRHAGIRLLGRGHESYSTPLRLEVQMASQRAIEAVERAGGSIETVYYSRLTLRSLLKPHRFEAAPVGKRHGAMRPRPALPPPKLMTRIYMSERHRGYLRQLQPGDVVRPQEHPAHVDLSVRQKPRYPGWAAADADAMASGRPYIKADGTCTASGAKVDVDAVGKAPSSRAIQTANPRRRGNRPYVPGERA